MINYKRILKLIINCLIQCVILLLIIYFIYKKMPAVKTPDELIVNSIWASTAILSILLLISTTRIINVIKSTKNKEDNSDDN